jgi:hypothetical protein
MTFFNLSAVYCVAAWIWAATCLMGDNVEINRHPVFDKILAFGLAPFFFWMVILVLTVEWIRDRCTWTGSSTTSN